MPSQAWSSILALLLLALSFTLAQLVDCQAPIILSPATDTTSPAAFFLSGTIVRSSTCGNGDVSIMSGSRVIRTMGTELDGSFRHRLEKEPFGANTYYVVHSLDTAGTYRSDPITLKIQCAPPLIQQPGNPDWVPEFDEYADVVIDYSRTTLSGYADCPFVSIEITGKPPIVVGTDPSGAYMVRSMPLVNGRYTLNAVGSADMDGSFSARSKDRNLRVAASESFGTCHSPQLSGPFNTDDPSSVVINGFVDIDSDCHDGLVRIMSPEIGEVVVGPTDDNGRFAIIVAKPEFGTRNFYALHTIDTQERLRSNTISTTVNCATPIIDLPGPGVNNQPLTITDSRPLISGSSNCPFVTIRLGSLDPVTVPTDESGGFSYQSRQLRNGEYGLTVVAAVNDQGSASTQSSERRFVVDSAEPFATAGMERRAALSRNRCKPEEERCRFIGVGRKRNAIEYKCFPDLSTNLERCGSCTGPDCSAIPNVDAVSCQEGRCEAVSEVMY